LTGVAQIGINCFLSCFVQHTQDCSGHEAGYEWAEEHGIDDPDDCSGNSESFIEGCRAYAEEQQEQVQQEEDERAEQKPEARW
jgi:hypothetical protein